MLAPPDLAELPAAGGAVGFAKPKMYIIDKATGYPGTHERDRQGRREHPVGELLVARLSREEQVRRRYTGQQLVDAYEKATGKQYIPPLGYDDAAYDVLFDALQRRHTGSRRC